MWLPFASFEEKDLRDLPAAKQPQELAKKRTRSMSKFSNMKWPAPIAKHHRWPPPIKLTLAVISVGASLFGSICLLTSAEYRLATKVVNQRRIEASDKPSFLRNAEMNRQTLTLQKPKADIFQSECASQTTRVPHNPTKLLNLSGCVGHCVGQQNFDFFCCWVS